MVREITFNNSIINDASSCYVIAEIGNNHQGDVNNAKKLIQAAKSSGASAVKFQRRDNKELFTSERRSVVTHMKDKSWDTLLVFLKDPLLEYMKVSSWVGL